ncbi:MAG: hypothetical protein A2Z88_10115 [Omnitrophica WOR_2 bacterium GWA2_47_8]|nr:MAG: hypothetical protein A2Z88_10115 [Omnitrophica WOR_2 bacterium GWA2_47_8]
MASSLGLNKSFNYLREEGQDMFRRLVEAVRVGFYVADQEGNLFYVNHAFVSILGYNTKDELIGRNLAKELYADPTDREEFLKAMSKTGFVKDYEIKNKGKDGNIVILSVTSNFIRDDREQVIGVEGVVYDVTELKHLRQHSEVLSEAIEQTADSVVVTNKEGIIQYVNSAFERTTGFTKDDVVNKTPRILKSGYHPSEYYRNLWETVLRGDTFRSITTNKKKNGELFYCDQTITPLKNEKGEMHCFVSILKDITERKIFEDKLQSLNQELAFEKYKLEQILDFDEKISTITDLHKLVDFFIEKACDILESDRCSLMLFDENTQELCLKGAVGLNDEIMSQCKLRVGEGISGKVVESAGPILVKDTLMDKRFLFKENNSYKSRSFISVPIKFDSKLIGVVNITDKRSTSQSEYNELDLKILTAIVRQAAIAIENVQMYKELQYLTVTDSMTNLYNYRYFIKSLDHEIARANRSTEPLYLLMCDIDHFKAYNDTLGHLEGDILLKKVGQVLKDNLREIDIVCRYAGDEFVVVLFDASLSGAQIVAEKIRARVKEIAFGKMVTISIGLAQYAPNMSRRELISKADRALYMAKNSGRDKVCVLGK